MAPPGPAHEGSDGEDLLGFLRLDPVAEGEMQHVPVVPFEPGDPQVRSSPSNTLHYRSRQVKQGWARGDKVVLVLLVRFWCLIAAKPKQMPALFTTLALVSLCGLRLDRYVLVVPSIAQGATPARRWAGRRC